MIRVQSIPTTSDFFKEHISRGRRVGMMNLGCARNLVDAQTILGRLQQNGCRVTDIGDADVAIVNTCAFVEEAKKESLEAIAGLVALKRQKKLQKVIVAGCLAQRYAKELAAEFKEIDAVVGVQKLDPDGIPPSLSLTPAHYAYVKICESCYNHCRFCVIPSIKGKFVSRTMESIVEEIRRLDERGVKEVNLIGQDITAYGMDLSRRQMLAGLLKEIAAVARNIRWIRLLYAFPAHVTDELIEVIAREEKICKYIDLPLQHISDRLLKSMDRKITAQETTALIRTIRRKIPQAHLRTTFIVGLPGETKKDFEALMRFVEEMRFDKMGAFIYSREEGTPACAMPGQVPERLKKERFDLLMRCQQAISEDLQQKRIGRVFDVLVDEKDKDEDVYIGRTACDAPEVDGVVYVRSKKKLKAGDRVPVKITDAYEYDLAGEACGSAE